MDTEEIRDQRFLDYLSVFSSTEGQRVLEDMRKAFANRISHTPGDPYQTAFLEGERAVILRIDFILSKARELTRKYTSPGPKVIPIKGESE